MSNTQKWYIVKTQDQTCQIVSFHGKQTPDSENYWGPFDSQSDAIARRVGLIRSGKCQPM